MGLFKSALVLVTFLGVFMPSTLSFALDTAVSTTEPAQSEYKLFSNDYSLSDLKFDSSPGKLQMFWKTRVYGEAASLPTQSSQVGGFDVNFEAQYNLFENLYAQVSLRPKYEAGRSQSFFGDLEPSSGILVREASITYAPVKFVDLKAGVIFQDWMEMPLLTDRQAFPGANIDLHHSWNSAFKTGVNAQYLIPTSQTLSSRTVDREQTPSYQTQMLYAKWDDGALDVYQSLGHFRFDHLPSVVAWEGEKYGNQNVVIFSPNNSYFLNGFNGWFTQTTLGYRFTSVWKQSVYMNVLKNTEARETYNDGQSLGLQSDFYLENYKITGILEHYFIEADTVPAVYNSWGHGHTNKEGNGLEVKVAFLKKKFRIRGQFMDFKPINYNSNQQSQQYYYLGVETGYDEI